MSAFVGVWFSDTSARIWTRWRCKHSSLLYACSGTEAGSSGDRTILLSFAGW